MLDIKEVRKDPEGVSEALAIKGFAFDVEAFKQIDARRKTADVNAQDLQAERKSASKQIGSLIASGMSVEDAKAQVEETLTVLGQRLEAAEAEAKDAQAALHEMMIGVPNVPDPCVPAGKDEDDNQLIAQWGQVKPLPFEAKDHVDLGTALGGLDSD